MGSLFFIYNSWITASPCVTKMGPSLTPLTNLNSGFRVYEVDSAVCELLLDYRTSNDIKPRPSKSWMHIRSLSFPLDWYIAHEVLSTVGRPTLPHSLHLILKSTLAPHMRTSIIPVKLTVKRSRDGHLTIHWTRLGGTLLPKVSSTRTFTFAIFCDPIY